MNPELNFQNPMGVFKIFFLILVACVHAEVDPMGDNVCLKSESYNVKQIVSKSYPYTTNSVQWCWSLKKFFRCNTSKTEWKIVHEPKIVTKTKLVAKCCSGYREKYTKCVPDCVFGCGAGICIAPEKCDCPAGLYGLFCETPCPKNRWGENCVEKCICFNGGVCDKISGICNCTSEWQGRRCELPIVHLTTIKPLHATSTEARKTSFEEEKTFKERIIGRVKDINKTATEDIETTVEEKALKQSEREDINRVKEKFHNTTTEAKEKILKKVKNEKINSDIKEVNERITEDEKIVLKDAKQLENKNFDWPVNGFLEISTEIKKENVETFQNEKIDGTLEGGVETTTESKGKEIMKNFKNNAKFKTINNVKVKTVVAGDNVFEEESSASGETSRKSYEVLEHTEPIMRHTTLNEISGTNTRYSDANVIMEFTTTDDITTRSTEFVNPEILILINNSKDIDWKTENDIEIESDSVSEHQKKTAKLVYFIPSLSVLSGVTVLIFLIVGRWWLVSHKKKLKKIQKEKEEKKFRAAWQRKGSRDDTFIANNYEGNSSYIPDIDIHVSVPVLQTFKPLDSGTTKKPQN